MVTRELQARAAQEVIHRRQSRNGLLPFTCYTYPQYKVDPVHELIASTLDQVVSGEIKRLMIFAPPQHGKSELTSVRLPAYWLGRRPNDPVILASYVADLAEKHSRESRQIVESPEYAALFGKQATDEFYDKPIATRADSRAVHRWQLTHPWRGGLRAVGVNGPVTGHGALLGIIDDPFENWKQAQSLTMRDSVWDWWRGTFRPRIWEGGAIILIMTRWHEDDLAGRLLQVDGAAWMVLRLPALAETQQERDQNNEYLGLPIGEPDPLGRLPGEALSPQRFSATTLVEMQKEGEVGSLAFAAEYQGVPRAAEGNRFKRIWFYGEHNDRVRPTVPEFASYVRYWDKAGTQGGTGAATAGVLLAKHEKLTYVVDVVKGHWSAGEREAEIKATAARDALKYGQYNVRIYVEQEPGSGGKESAEATIANLAGYIIEADPPSGNKDARLEPFAVQLEAGNVRMVIGDWNKDYIEEFVALPNGKRRDQADATAGAFNKLHSDDAPGFMKTKTRWPGQR